MFYKCAIFFTQFLLYILILNLGGIEIWYAIDCDEFVGIRPLGGYSDTPPPSREVEQETPSRLAYHLSSIQHTFPFFPGHCSHLLRVLHLQQEICGSHRLTYGKIILCNKSFQPI